MKLGNCIYTNPFRKAADRFTDQSAQFSLRFFFSYLTDLTLWYEIKNIYAYLWCQPYTELAILSHTKIV